MFNLFPKPAVYGPENYLYHQRSLGRRQGGRLTVINSFTLAAESVCARHRPLCVHAKAPRISIRPRPEMVHPHTHITHILEHVYMSLCVLAARSHYLAWRSAAAADG